jgi:hypothetical protein
MLGVFSAGGLSVWKYAKHEAMYCRENSEFPSAMRAVSGRAVSASFPFLAAGRPVRQRRLPT